MNNSKLISLLLVLAMVLSMVVLPVAAVEEADAPETTETTAATEAPEPAAPEACPLHPDAEWTEVTAADWAAGAALTTGHYFLTENVDLTAALTVAADQTVCIDLAGKNLTQTTAFSTSPTEAHRVLEVTGGTLTVMDSTAAEVDGVYTSGVISGGWANGRAGSGKKAFGGNVYLVEGATFTLYGGTISGGKVNRHGIGEDATYGGNIYADSPEEGAVTTVNIYGGLVKDGVASSGYTNTNTNADRDANVYGGNIAVLNGTVLNIFGGVITGGKAENNFIASKSQGTYAAGGGNLYIQAGSVVTIFDGEISNGAAISNNKGITVTAADGTVYDALVANATGGNIYMTGSASELNISGGVIKDGSASATAAPYGEEGVIGSATASARGGNIYTYHGTVNVSGGKVQGGTTAASATGTDTSVSRYGGNIYNSNIVNITGGTVSGGEAREGGTIFNSKTVNISGGELIGGTAVYGGGIFQNADQTVNITGGVVEGGMALQGGAIYTKGTVNVSGGEVTGGTAMAVEETPATYFKLNNNISKGGNFYVSGGTVTVSGNAKVTDGCTYFRGGNFFTTGGSTVILKDNAVVSGGHNYFAALSDDGGNVSIEATDELPAVEGKVSAEWGGNFYNTGALKMYDNAVVKNGIAARGGNYAAATSNGDLYMYGGAIYGGNAKRSGETSDDIKFYNHAGCLIEMYAGYIGIVKDEGDSNVMNVYGGALTCNNEVTAACEKVHVTSLGTNSYIFWHADGTCDTCGHTFAAAGADTACETCSAVHETAGGVHSYVEGVCSVCGYEAAAHSGYDCGCENPAWVAWDGVTLEDGGHYYLTDDLQLAAAVTVSDAITVCIDLNGYTLTAAPGERVFNLAKNANCTVNVMNGTVRGSGAAAADGGGLIMVGAGATFVGYDATFIGGKTTQKAGGNFYVNGQVYLRKCEILNGQIDNEGATRGSDGGNFAIYNEDAVVHLIYCKVADGDVGTGNNAYGGNIYCGSNSTVVLEHTEVTGGRANDGGNIFLMNSKTGGHAYIYGDSAVKDAHEDTACGFYVYGSADYISNLYVFGGYIEEIKDRGNENEIMLFNGTFGFDPRTANTDGSSMVGECACVSYDEETGLYTVSHATAEYCDFCKSYSRQHPVVYANVGGHTYTDSNVCDSCGLVTAKIGDVEYTELAKALDAAEATDTVVLMRDITVADLNLYTTLDLNGNAVKANGIVDASNADAHIVDSVGTGSVAAEEVKMYETNNQLAVLVDGAYKYEDVSAKQKIQNVDATTKYLTFIIEDEAADTLLDDVLVNGDEFIVRITVTWNDGANVHHFNYNADLVKAYGLDADGNSVWGEKMFTCTINGLDEIGEHTITAEVVSGGVVVAAVTVA